MTPLPKGALCSSVEITGCFVPSPSPSPALVFQFTHRDGTVLPAVIFVFDETTGPTIRQVVATETRKAILAARAVRGMS